MTRHIVIAGTQRDALDKCHEVGLAPPPHSREGEVVLIFTVSQPHRVCGFRFQPGDTLHTGYMNTEQTTPAQRTEWNLNWDTVHLISA